MAQRAEKEETEYKLGAPDNISLCANCGGVALNSAAADTCRNCFNVAVTASAKRSFRSSSSARPPPQRKLFAAEASREAATEAKREVNRCSGCRRKVGLTGFRCRCGELFCSDHRYSDRHDCSFDYKSAGREAIARENPVVRAAKIVKI